jgi:protein-S-isoprenylcysteine O-methyltransferase Ste14
MKALPWLAAIVLFFEMPVPIYWLVLHTRIQFWRQHVLAGYWIAIVLAWGGGDALLYHFRQQLFDWRAAAAPSWLAVPGLLLIALDLFAFASSEMHLGTRRLVGQAELTGTGELAVSGLYTRIRHPRYFGMIAGVLGGSLLIGLRPLWIISIFWCGLALSVIVLEERELRLRFGSAYSDYARRVPALLPFRFR